MGGRRHKGIGMNRPKKSKVAVAEVPEVINESEEDSDHEEEPEPEPQPESHTLPAAAPAVPVAADCLAASPAIPTCGTKRQRGRPAQTPLQREEKKVQAAYRAWEQAEDDFDPWCEGATRAMLDAAGCTFENMSEHVVSGLPPASKRDSTSAAARSAQRSKSSGTPTSRPPRSSTRCSFVSDTASRKRTMTSHAHEANEAGGGERTIAYGAGLP